MMIKNAGILAVITIACMFTGCRNVAEFRFMEGGIYGTIYHISYRSDKDLSQSATRAMESVNESLSMFNPNSVISKLNNGTSDEVDSLFVRMYTMGVEVNKATGGAFDITVAPLVNAWGFGYKEHKFPEQQDIDSLLLLVGMDKLELENGRLKKKAEGVAMDASSIAKGLGVDMVAECLERAGVTDYMVEIGGEVRVKGKNDKGKSWRIGIDKPLDNPGVEGRPLEMVVQLSSGALATSGNYRNYYIHEGRKYAHTINPLTGYPVQRDIVSSSVYAPSCMEADAYATAFMVLGLEKAKEIVENNTDLEACFIFEEGDQQKIWVSLGFKKMILEE